MSQFERKFGRYAVSKLSMKLVILYVIGYVLYYVQPGVFSLLTLNVAAVLHGQVWRVLSWLLVPPDPGSNLFFVAIMLYFYYSIGTSLERVWGDYKYNVYVFLGILLTILSAFAWYAFLALRGLSGLELAQMATYSSALFSTYYINMCIFLAFALTFPDAQGLPAPELLERQQRGALCDRGSPAQRPPPLSAVQKLDELLARPGAQAAAVPQVCHGGEKGRARQRQSAQVRNLRTDGEGRRRSGIPLLFQM